MSNVQPVTITQEFQYEVEKQSRKREAVFEYMERSNGQLRVEIIEGIPYIIANRAGMLALAKLLITIGAASRSADLRLHVRQDFDGSQEEVLRIRLEQGRPETANPSGGPSLAVA
ncbi:MAG TPA: hypothetical protein VL240_07775 [Candidatus Binatia bacterium]|nr:hypothetical protein [Candidatus Binatia bacterium]